MLLLHDPALLGVVDAWVSGIEAAVFDDLLPLLRRTFAAFSATERRRLGTHIARGGAASTTAAAPVDDDRALPAVLAAARMLGLEVAS